MIQINFWDYEGASAHASYVFTTRNHLVDEKKPCADKAV